MSTERDTHPPPAGTHAYASAMQRVHYDDDHRAFADLAGDFAAKEVAPHINGWDDDGIIPREVFAKAGAVGLLGFAADERVRRCRRRRLSLQPDPDRSASWTLTAVRWA